MTPQEVSARLRQALRPIDDDGQQHGGPDDWSPSDEEISEWNDSFHEAANPEAIRTILDALAAAQVENERLRVALTEFVSAMDEKRAANEAMDQTVATAERSFAATDRLWANLEPARASLSTDSPR